MAVIITQIFPLMGISTLFLQAVPGDASKSFKCLVYKQVGKGMTFDEANNVIPDEVKNLCDGGDACECKKIGNYYDGFCSTEYNLATHELHGSCIAKETKTPKVGCERDGGFITCICDKSLCNNGIDPKYKDFDPNEGKGKGEGKGKDKGKGEGTDDSGSDTSRPSPWFFVIATVIMKYIAWND